MRRRISILTALVIVALLVSCWPSKPAEGGPKGFELIVTLDGPEGFSLYSFDVPDGRLYLAYGPYGLAMSHVGPIVSPGTDQKEGNE